MKEKKTAFMGKEKRKRWKKEKKKQVCVFTMNKR